MIKEILNFNDLSINEFNHAVDYLETTDEYPIDLNTIQTAGLYRINFYTNGPTDYTGMINLQVHDLGSVLSQMFWFEKTIFNRKYENDIWSEWVSIIINDTPVSTGDMMKSVYDPDDQGIDITNQEYVLGLSGEIYTLTGSGRHGFFKSPFKVKLSSARIDTTIYNVKNGSKLEIDLEENEYYSFIIDEIDKTLNFSNVTVDSSGEPIPENMKLLWSGAAKTGDVITVPDGSKYEMFKIFTSGGSSILPTHATGTGIQGPFGSARDTLVYGALNITFDTTDKDVWTIDKISYRSFNDTEIAYSGSSTIHRIYGISSMGSSSTSTGDMEKSVYDPLNNGIDITTNEWYIDVPMDIPRLVGPGGRVGFFISSIKNQVTTINIAIPSIEETFTIVNGNDNFINLTENKYYSFILDYERKTINFVSNGSNSESIPSENVFKTTIWENEDISLQFDTQTITFDYDIKDSDVVEIIFCASNSIEGQKTYITSDRVSFSDINILEIKGNVDYFYSVTNARSRNYTIAPSGYRNSIWFGPGLDYLGENISNGSAGVPIGTSNNICMIPYKIIIYSSNIIFNNSIEPVLLWENPDRFVEMTDQIITIPEITNYKKFIVVMAAGGVTTGTFSNHFFELAGGIYAWDVAGLKFLSSKDQRRYIRITNVGLQIQNNRQYETDGSYTTANEYNIPVFVYGIPETPVFTNPEDPSKRTLIWRNENLDQSFSQQTIYFTPKNNVSYEIKAKLATSDHMTLPLVSLRNGDSGLLVGEYDLFISTRRIIIQSNGCYFNSGVEYNHDKTYTINDHVVIPYEIWEVPDIITNNITEVRGAPELLWTNQTPMYNFAAQSINLDLTDYDNLIITASLTNDETWDRELESTTHFLMKNIEYNMSGSYHYMYRRVVKFTDTEIIFGPSYYSDATEAASETSDTRRMIPINIYGIRRSKKYNIYKDIYSSDEIMTDSVTETGEPIFRKTFEFPKLDTDTIKSFDLGIQIKDIISSYSHFVHSNGTVLKMPFDDNAGNSGYLNIYKSGEPNSYIQVFANGSMVLYNIKLTLEYTKENVSSIDFYREIEEVDESYSEYILTVDGLIGVGNSGYFKAVANDTLSDVFVNNVSYKVKYGFKNFIEIIEGTYYDFHIDTENKVIQIMQNFSEYIQFSNLASVLNNGGATENTLTALVNAMPLYSRINAGFSGRYLTDLPTGTGSGQVEVVKNAFNAYVTYQSINNEVYHTIKNLDGDWQPWKSTNVDRYMETEIATNKTWIDGKTIYRKVIRSASAVSKSLTVQEATGGFISINGYILNINTGRRLFFPFYNGPTNVYIHSINNVINITVWDTVNNSASTELSSESITLIVEYTKL